MGIAPSRKHLGKDFTEGARLLWQHARPSHRALAKKLGISTSFMHSLLFGDVLPGLTTLQACERVCGIPLSAWSEGPKKHFVPPAARHPSHPPRSAA